MKHYKKGSPVVIALEQSGIVDGKTIAVSIVGEKGQFITGNNVSLENIPLTFNNATSLYEVTINFAVENPDQNIRLYFSSNDVVIEDKYFPQDAELNAGFKFETEIIPVQYFIDTVLNLDSQIDKLYKQSLVSYLDKNRKQIPKYIRTAQDKLEKKSKLYFTERELVEMRDYNFDRFTLHLWFTEVNYPPLNELVSFEILYGENTIAQIDKRMFRHDRETGIIEFLPVPGGDSLGIYTLLLSNISGLGLSLFVNNNLERVPNMFRVTYKTGLLFDGCDPIEKDGIKSIIAKRAFMEMLPFIDSSLRLGSISESIDGVSSTFNYSTDKLIEHLKKEEDEYIFDLSQKYGRNVEGVII